LVGRLSWNYRTQFDDKLCRFRLGFGQRAAVAADLSGTGFGYPGGLVGSSHGVNLLSQMKSRRNLRAEEKNTYQFRGLWHFGREEERQSAESFPLTPALSRGERSGRVPLTLPSPPSAGERG